MPIQRQIGHQALELGVLVTQLPQLTQFQDPHLSADISDRLTSLGMRQRETSPIGYIDCWHDRNSGVTWRLKSVMSPLCLPDKR